MTTQPRLPGETDEQYDIRINKDIAAFSYLWIMSLVLYFARKDSKFIRFHAKQGIVLFLLTIPVSLIPVVGKIGMFFLVAGMLLGFVHAAQGQYSDIPVIGDLAKGDLKMTDLGRSIIQAVRRGLDAIEKMMHHSKKKNEKDVSSDNNMDKGSTPQLP